MVPDGRAGRSSAMAAMHPYGKNLIPNLTDMDGGDSEATSGAGMYLDARVAVNQDDYPDEPVGEDFTTNRSQSTAQKYS